MKITYYSASPWFVFICFAILSAYVVYKQATDLHAISLEEQVIRHERMLNGESEFYNPWQYRIFSTWVVEVFHTILHTANTRIDKSISFLFFRFLQNIFIFIIAWRYYTALGMRNPWLLLSGLLIMSFCMAHSVFRSDLSFNTYFDILFYLLAALLIIKKKIEWLVPLMFFAALNRETSLLIPAMLLIGYITFKPFKIDYKVLKITLAALLAFFIAFVGVRLYYGYQPPTGIHGMHTPMDFFVFNLKFKTMYPELVGTLAFVPLVVIIFLKRMPILLKQWFWIVCPAWFIIHLAYSTAVETRLFLVPQTLIFIPAFLWLIEHWYNHQIPSRENQG